MAKQYGNLGLIHQTRGDLGQACGLWRKAVALFAEMGAKPTETQVRGWMKEAGCGA
ncbi:MAG: hypothetical protein H7841_17590 [Magnetospirillum sp. WYHS-4]